MVTTAEQTGLEQEAAAQGAVPFPPATVIEFIPAEYEKVTVVLSGDPVFDNQQIDYAIERFWHGYLKNAAIAAEHAPKPPPPSQQQAPQGAQQPQRRPQSGGSRTSQYPPDNLVSTLNDATRWTCNKCNGTGEGVARRPQKGSMRSDAIVCLNAACKEGDFRYTLAWDDGPTEPERVSADDLPF